MNWRQTLANGGKQGLKTLWVLGKVIFPVTVIVTMLQYTPVVDGLVFLFKPMMGWFGLPGDAAIALALGKLLNIYAAIGAMLAMELTVKQVFILAVMVSFSHNLIVETAVARRIGAAAWVLLTVRLGLAFGSALVIDRAWSGGSEPADYSMTAGKAAEAGDWAGIAWFALKNGAAGMLQIAVIVIPLMFAIQVLRDMKLLPWLSKPLRPFTRWLGVSGQSALTLMAGLIFGIAYGAGVMIQAVKEDGLTVRDVYLVSIFLVACHAVIEDTLLFVPLGINVLPLLLIRFAAAVLLTALIAKLWPVRASERGSAADS